MYEFADVGATYSQGKSIAALDSDAQADGNSLVMALGNVKPGAEHGGSGLHAAIQTFQEDTSQDSSSLANAVSNLGENTARGSVEVVNTQNEGTTLATSNTVLARSLNVSPARA